MGHGVQGMRQCLCANVSFCGFVALARVAVVTTRYAQCAYDAQGRRRAPEWRTCVELEQLKYFIQVAEHGSFSRAADELSHLQWIPLERARGFDMPFITEVVLAEVAARLTRPEPPETVLILSPFLPRAFPVLPGWQRLLPRRVDRACSSNADTANHTGRTARNALRAIRRV